VEEQVMASLRLTIVTALATAALLGTTAPALAQQRGGGAPNQGKPADHGSDGHQLSHIYGRYYPYWNRYPHSGFNPGSVGTGFGLGNDYYGYLPANPPNYPRLIVIPPPPLPPLPPPLTPRKY
jgi:hypothetical protein